MITLTVSTEYTTIQPMPIRLSQELADRLRYMSPKATPYNSRYAKGQWDGMVTLYERHMSRFPTGLLQKVKGILSELGVEYEIKRKLPPLPEAHTRTYIPKHPLRPYQTEAVNEALKWRRGVIAVPTGGGKTEIAQAIIAGAGVPRVVFLVPSKAILRQTVRRMKDAFPEENVFQWGASKQPPAVPPESYVLVATVQSAFKAAHPMITKANMVIVDESHHQSAETFQQATRMAKQARYLLGLSATPYRHDRTDMELEAWIGPIIFHVQYEDLIKNGWLVPPRFKVVHTVEDGVLATLGKRTLIFSEKEADLLRAAPVFEKHGITVLTGKMSDRIIEHTLDRFQRGEITHIACTPIFDEGLDIGDIEAVFFYATCGARTRAMQRIGRGMRNGTTLKGEPKTDVLVVDLYDDKYDERRQAYKREPAFSSRM